MLQYLETSPFLSALVKDLNRFKAMGVKVDMLVLPDFAEQQIIHVFYGKEWPTEVFDLRMVKGKVHLYLHNVQVMFTKKRCRFYYLLSPIKEDENEQQPKPIQDDVRNQQAPSGPTIA